MALLRLGEIAIQRIVEHEIAVYAPTEMFDEATPEALEPYREWLEPNALCPRSGRLIMPVQSYLVQTRHHTILIDTCCGNEKNFAEPPLWHQAQNAAWLANLEAAGVRPEAVDFVFCTHLHSDHCGWNTRLVDGRWVPTFPNAKYIFAKEEYRAMEDDNHQIYIDNVQPIMEAGQAELVGLDYALDDEIWLTSTPGHSACHVAIELQSGRHRSSMCGDLIHSPLQLAEPGWNCNSDFDIPTAIRTRRDYLDTHCDTDTLILTAHFPSPSVGHIVSHGDRFDFDYWADSV